MPYKFDLEPGEELKAMYRKGEAVLFKHALIVSVLMYVPWAFLLKYDLAAQYRWWLLVLTFFAVAYAINAYILWLLNVTLLTNKRVIIVSYLNFLHKRVSEVPLGSLVNASYTARGIIAFLFGLGNVELLVHGQTTPVEILQVKQPEKIKQEILTAKSQAGNKLHVTSF